ncbi:MAG: FAD binding domain-containing protein [Anaerolineaceae bacterium]|nr:FAD binding domain-containing protein [Anaerolineaceae bacterium]
MNIYHPQTPLEAVRLRKENEASAVYLAGGTDDLRLGGAAEGKDLIDINALNMTELAVQGEELCIGAGCTLQDLAESELVPEFIREAARFCSSFARRNAATVGGNLGLRRDDSYLAAVLTAADAKLDCMTPHGEKEKKIGEYLQSDCKALIMNIRIAKDRTGWVRRFGNTAASHAAVIAAQSGDIYALSVHGSGLAYGDSPEIAESLTYHDDITGSADYKKYLAQTAFTLRR